MKSFKTIKEETGISIDPNDNQDDTVRVHSVWGNLVLQQQDLPKTTRRLFWISVP